MIPTLIYNIVIVYCYKLVIGEHKNNTLMDAISESTLIVEYHINYG